MGTLGSWSEQARDLIENKPGVILAAVGVSGFVMGALLRHGIAARKSGRDKSARNTLPGFLEQSLPADPFVLFVAGVAAGAVAGPALIRGAVQGAQRYEPSSPSSPGLRTTSDPGAASQHTSSMDERPFERI